MGREDKTENKMSLKSGTHDGGKVKLSEKRIHACIFYRNQLCRVVCYHPLKYRMLFHFPPVNLSDGALPVFTVSTQADERNQSGNSKQAK